MEPPMSQDTAATLRTYAEAWDTRDPARRAALLEECLAAEGVYADPNVETTGRAALGAYIGAFLDRGGGARIVVTSGLDVHHGRGHFTWEMRTPDGTVAIAGRDFVRFDAEGRLAEIAGFFGPPPALPD